MAPVQQDKYYVFTIALFSEGKFIGFGQFHTGARTPQERYSNLELIWGKKAGLTGYTTVSMSSSFDFQEDSFFEDLTLTRAAKEMPGIPNQQVYEGFRVVGFAAKPPSVMDQSMGNVVRMNPEEAAAKFPKLVLLLYQDFTEQQDYLRFVETKKPKR
jgi:hypothetical protein